MARLNTKAPAGRPGHDSKFTSFLSSRRFQRKLFIWGGLTPILIWFVIFMFLPIIMVFIYSFTNAHMAFSDYKFVGLSQYIKMFTKDPILLIALWNTVKAVLFIVPGTIVLATLLAVALNSVAKALREVFTFIYFLPSIISMVAISLVWQWLYHQHYGLINAFLTALGFEAQPFLNSTAQALFCLCVVEIWSIMGYYAVILLAAIRDIDLCLYEAAQIDGATGAKQFRYITLPMIQPSLLFVGIMSTISAFMIFTPVKVLTDGAPGTSTMVLMLHILNRGIKSSDIGYASALSILLLAIILTVSLLQWILSRESKREGRKG